MMLVSRPTLPVVAVSLHRGVGLLIVAVTALVLALVITAIVNIVTSDPADFVVGSKPLWIILVVLTGPIGAAIWYLADFRHRSR